MALTLTAISPGAIAYDGGHRLELTGTFALGHGHRVYVGLLETVDDTPCLSGVAGQGTVCYPVTATRLVVYSPRLVTHVGHSVLVKDLETLETSLLSGVLAVYLASYQLTTFGLRALLPRRWRTGPRSLDRVPPLG